MSKAILCVVYGNYLFDGRARRHVEELVKYRDVVVINLSVHNEQKETKIIAKGKNTITLIDSSSSVSNVLFKHLVLFYTLLVYVFKNKPNVIVSLNYFTIYIVLSQFFLRKSIYIYDAYELLITDANSTRRDKFWFEIEKMFIKRYDIVLAANEERAVLMKEYYGKLFFNKLLEIRNIPRFSQELKDSVEVMKGDWNSKILQSDNVVLYQGDVTLDRNLEKYIAAFYSLPTDYKILIVGDGVALPKLRSQFKDLEDQNRLICTGRIENNKLYHFTGMGKVGIVSYPYSGLNNIYCSPNKIYEYAQFGLALLCSQQPPLENVINKYGIGKCVSKEESSELIAQKIEEIFSSIKTYQQNIRSFAEENTWEREVKEYRLILDKIT